MGDIKQMIGEWRNNFASPYSNIAFDFLERDIERHIKKNYTKNNKPNYTASELRMMEHKK